MASIPILPDLLDAPLSPPTQPISGFWRRFAAFAIDSILLGIVGAIFGAILFEQFAALGSWGRLLGLLVAVPYFGLANSEIGSGQTLGKRLMGVRVVDQAGRSITPARSLSRSFIFLLPFALNGAAIGKLNMWNYAVQSVLLFLLGGGIIYFAVFNRATRQSIHDLICHTFVVEDHTSAGVSPAAVWQGHWAVLALVVAISMGSSAWIFGKMLTWPMLQQMISIQHAIQENDKYEGVSVMKTVTRDDHTYLTVTARVRRRPDFEGEADALAGAVLAKSPNAIGTDQLVVNVIYGYDLGFASSWETYRADKTPAEWRLRTGQ